MPLYKIEIFKTLGPGRKPWSNVYHTFATDLGFAVGMADVLIGIEQENHQDYVTLLRTRTSNPALPGTDFQVEIYNAQGSLTGFGNALPMWNTVRVDFNVEGGRPSRKYYRFPITETDQDGGALVSGALTRLGTDLVGPLMTIITSPPSDALLTDESGNQFNNVTVWPFLAERKTYRRKAKKNGDSGPPVS